jgi:hypothetical protein
MEVLHPHGEAQGPGARSQRTEAQKQRIRRSTSMTNDTDVRFRASHWEFGVVAAEDVDTRDARDLASGGREVWIAPRAGEPTRVRSFKVSRLLRDGRADWTSMAVQDARMDARSDARGREPMQAAARKLQSQGEDIEIMYGYADAFHPHGEATRPGAQRCCTEREKNAIGGAHPHYDYLDQYRYYGSADAC